MTNFKEYLESQLEQRKARNPRYSLRAFAGSLGVSPAQLSQMLSGKRVITLETISKVSDRLGISPIEKQEFMKAEFFSPAPDRKSHQLKEDQFALIADWYHLAILSLCHQKNAKNDSYWVAKKLGLTVAVAKEALQRLNRLDLIEVGLKLKQKTSPLSVISAAPSPAIQKFHRQVLQLAEEKLVSVSPEQRDYSAVTFNVSPKNIKRARQMIEKFQSDMSDLLSTQEESETYMLSCQFFPLTIKSQGEK
ncbi:MAG: TIGR02147 family protein [Pseudobdellovibrionaceae bacterium]